MAPTVPKSQGRSVVDEHRTSSLPDFVRAYFWDYEEGRLDWDRHRVSPRRLRFWGFILDLPEEQVDEWVATARSQPWHRRTSR